MSTSKFGKKNQGVVMDQKQLLIELVEFISSRWLWNQFEQDMYEKGYTEEEIEEALDG